MKKRSKKKTAAILFFIALLIAFFPDVISDPQNGEKPSPDFGVYDAMEDVHNEMHSRANTPELLDETQGSLDEFTLNTSEERVDLTSRREIVSPVISVPPMMGVFKAMVEYDSINNNELTDWLLPPQLGGDGGTMHYFIYSRYTNKTSVVEQWTNASLRQTLFYPELNLDNWWGVDVDDDLSDDIEVLFDSSVSDLSINLTDRTFESTVTVYFNIRKISNLSFSPSDFEELEVYISKFVSYSDRNIIFFIGQTFTNVVDEFECTIVIENVKFSSPGIPWPPIPPFQIDFGEIESFDGPYYFGWDSKDEELSSYAIEVAVARIEFVGVDEYVFLNRSWLTLDFLKKNSLATTVPMSAELFIDSSEDLSTFDEITWDGGSQGCDARFKFFDSHRNVSYADIFLDDMPGFFKITESIEERNGRNVTIMDYSASSMISFISLKNYEFFNTTYEDVNQRIADGDYTHLYMNLSRLPRKLYMETIYHLEPMDTSMPVPMGVGIVPAILDVMCDRTMSYFSRMAKTMSTIPQRILSTSEEGTYSMFHTYNTDDIDEIEFYFTSGDYATSFNETENYIAFYNNTRPSDYPIIQMSISARISDIKYFKSSYENVMSSEVKIMDNEPFRAIFVDEINSLNAEVIISNVPGHITVYETSDYMSYDGGGVKIDELRFLSEYQGGYLDLKIIDLYEDLFLEYQANRTHITTGSPQDAIGEIEFMVTTGPIFRMEGNHLLLHQENDFSVLSGRLVDASRIEYIPGEGGRLEINFTEENPIRISLLDNRDEILSEDIIIDPMPKFVSVNLSGLFLTEQIRFPLPELSHKGVMGFVETIYAVSTLGNTFLEVMDESTQNAIANIGNIMNDLSISYSSTTSTTIIGKIQRGEYYSLDDVNWVHGISARQKVKSEETFMVAKIYLTGLPRYGSISTKVQDDDIYVDFHLNEYRPLYNWICIDVRGLQDRDVLLYVNDIKEGMDLDLRVDFAYKLNEIPMSAIGSVNMNSDKRVGSLWGKMTSYTPQITMSEIFLSSVPKSLHADFNISGNIFIDFEAENGIESMYIKNTRKRDGEFHKIYAIVHELPREMEVSITPDTDFDMDDPPLQSLPSMNITSAGNTLDAYAFFDGKGIGQIGKAEIQVMNVADNINAKPSTDKYEVESNGVGYFWVHVMELPLTEDYTSKSIEIVGKDIKSFDVKYGAIFGTYPIITIDNTHGGELQFLMDLESGDSGRSIAMIDFKTNGGIPSSPSILINGGSIDLDKGSTHVMVPAPILSLWVDILT